MALVERAALAEPPLAAGLTNPGFFRRRFPRLFALSQLGFPFSIGRARNPIDRFRALARRSRHAGRRARLPASLAMTIAWPLGAFVTARRRCKLARARGRPYGLRQLADMYWLALRHSIPPLEYELYGFDDPARRAAMGDYVYWNDAPGLGALVARSGADTRDVQDKDRFARLCADHGLPHVPTLAVFDGGRQTWPEAPFEPRSPALWVKALRLRGGAGAARWTRQGETYVDGGGRRLSPTALAEWLRGQDCIVQPLAFNHADVAPLTNGALAALRVVTGMNGDGVAEYVTALMGLPYGGRETSVAAIVCSIEPGSGRLARAMLANGEPVERHPDTGATIAGTMLPFWAESVSLARRAHAEAFPRFPFLGWDIALIAEGPLLLETNAGWGALFHQMLDGPLGLTPFARLVARHV